MTSAPRTRFDSLSRSCPESATYAKPRRDPVAMYKFDLLLESIEHYSIRAVGSLKPARGTPASQHVAPDDTGRARPVYIYHDIGA